jgi:WD40 repeat protein
MDKPMFAVAFSPDGKTLAATGADGIGYLWKREGNTFDSPRVLYSDGGTLGQISFSPDGRRVVATARANGTAVVTPLVMDARQLEVDGSGEGLFGVAFSPDSRYLLTASKSSNIARLLAIDDTPSSLITELPDLIKTDVLISSGIQQVSDTQLNQTECSILRKMQIPIFDVIPWENAFCPYPFLWRG